MPRKLFTELYDDFWKEGLWAAPWSKAVSDLSIAQAIWKPAPGRKSIWQMLSHVIFWRDYNLDRSLGGAKLSEEEIGKRQYAEPANPTESDWNELKKKLESSHQAFTTAISDQRLALDKVGRVLAHDAYHLGQIMYIRALQGMKAID